MNTLYNDVHTVVNNKIGASRKEFSVSKKEGGYVRVKEPTQLAIRAIAGRIQAKEARVVSADDAIWWMVKTYLPEVAEEIQARADHDSDEDGK